ncbi:hypothetical protein F9817_23075 [Vibrio sp. CAIM 722]|uniref:Prepilin type IV endopeptidase peptidase domain-containing protein n=1 Tax=Vibrio eleionomae TaxID=2653505 RepID=A0A7X4RX31_9VIBR|nr:prepilin peptidase [Vibrio eleionomae]MZI96070.1 hypothetical protein [Vibrio eleionomae]
MMNSFFNIHWQGLLVLILALVLMKLLVTDVLYRRISNLDVIIILITILILRLNEIDYRVTTQFLLVLGLGFLVVSFGICGAGDIKLLSVLSLAIHPNWFILVVVLMLWLGGILAGSIWLFYKFRYPNQRYTGGVPYAIPIVISCSFGMWLTMISTAL